MDPKKAKEFIKQTAEQLQIPEELVKDLLDAYWKEVRLILTKGSEPVIYIKNLATFTIKKQALDDKIEDQERILEKIDKTVFRNFGRSKAIESDVERLKLMRDKNQEIELLKIQHKKKRDAYNMEKSKTDSGRNSE